jgi:hypothetical protein
MAISAKVQRDYLLTEASISLPASVSEVDEIMIASKTNGKLTVIYNDGHIQGINIEQRTRISDSLSVEVRAIVAVGDANL